MALQRAKRGEARTALLNATAALLAERPGLDVSLSEIAQRSGQNSALIKYYFGSKEGLLMAILERDAERSMADFESLVRLPVSAEQKMRIHINGIINAYYLSPYLNRLINHLIVSGLDHSAQRVAEIFVEPMVAAYRTIVAQGVEEGLFQPVDPGMLYYSVVGACEHIFYAAYALPTTLGIRKLDEATKQRYVRHVAALCLGGILVRNSTTSGSELIAAAAASTGRAT
jgi:AcrR family transcriptional regulator